MSLMQDFKKFALRGNVVDLAVGVIIGAAFGKIVDSIVNDLIMPLIGSFADADFSNLYVPLSHSAKAAVAANPHLALVDAKKAGAVFAWGNFLTVTLNFLILAFIIFVMVRLISRFKDTTPPSSTLPIQYPTPTDKLLIDMRGGLKNKP